MLSLLCYGFLMLYLIVMLYLAIIVALAFKYPAQIKAIGRRVVDEVVKHMAK
jgi:hypothetical protein